MTRWWATRQFWGELLMRFVLFLFMLALLGGLAGIFTDDDVRRVLGRF